MEIQYRLWSWWMYLARSLTRRSASPNVATASPGWTHDNRTLRSSMPGFFPSEPGAVPMYTARATRRAADTRPSVGIRRAHDFVTVGAPHPLQEAAIAALALPAEYYVELREGYRRRRDLLLGYLEQAGFVTWKPSGAYYILTDVGHFMKALRLPDDAAFAMWMVKELGVATVPGSSFYAHPELGRTKIRFCFPKTDDVLREAGQRLQKLRTIAG